MTLPAGVRRFAPYILSVVLGFLGGYLVIALFLFPASGSPQEAVVPNAVGVNYDVAVGMLQKAGFLAQQGETRQNATAPDRTVLAQKPAAGARATLGSLVTLDVSRRPGSARPAPAGGRAGRGGRG